MATTKRVVEYEYDATGKVIKETVTETTTPDPAPGVYLQPYVVPHYPWWQIPTITCGTSTIASTFILRAADGDEPPAAAGVPT